MQKSTEPSVTQPVTGEAQSESANAVHSANENSAPQNVVPPNFVEIYQIPKPVASPVEEEETRETVDKAKSPGEEHTTGEVTPREQEQETPKKEPLPSDITFQTARAAFYRGDVQESIDLVYKFSAQAAAERKAEEMAQARAAEDPSDDQENEEEFAEEEPSEPEPEPDYQFGVKIGGSPGKTVGLTEMRDLLRVGGAIQEFRFLSTEDAVIDLFRRSRSFLHLQIALPALYECLILPRNVESFRTTRELFDEIVALLQKHVMLPRKECSLLAYWAIATWFTDYLPLLPNIVISGPASTADLLLRTLEAVCRRPVLLGELSPLILRKLPIAQITPTLLIREAQLNRYTSALLNASAQPGYLFFNGETFEQFYCPKCIYVGELFKDPPATSNSIQINLGGSVLRYKGVFCS